ncbi:glutathione peroxidase [Peptoniphilus duerdenii]|uniref:Glutathione peroxidase n=1 Tax=Peptoniphilus duerdenii ATCC BAA-1640 TaxID=862517 RepID=E0NM23_9FIRM|nr:glutathione peroxidase [Peptoniphilus duerdenii]EFM25078.1 glutathione peroxidase [Peptoniphilus duerdenii ATCC BAA-1640]
MEEFMIYDYIVKDNEGRDISLKDFEGKVLLIVNTATKCGFTPQYEGLEALYEKYKDRGFVILDFPCNQFGGQAPGNSDEIKSFCSLNFGTTFPQFEKVDVNGENESPLFTYLKSQQKGILGGAIKWNFTKFLVDRNGNVTDRFAPSTKPEKIEEKIEELL